VFNEYRLFPVLLHSASTFSIRSRDDSIPIIGPEGWPLNGHANFRRLPAHGLGLQPAKRIWCLCSAVPAFADARPVDIAITQRRFRTLSTALDGSRRFSFGTDRIGVLHPTDSFFRKRQRGAGGLAYRARVLGRKVFRRAGFLFIRPNKKRCSLGR
jgi:hypothetical protein